jgi:hypothetical protein
MGSVELTATTDAHVRSTTIIPTEHAPNDFTDVHEFDRCPGQK